MMLFTPRALSATVLSVDDWGLAEGELGQPEISKLSVARC